MDLSETAAVLITGGAGFIGAHVAKALADRGIAPVTFDSLASGHAEAVRWGPLIVGDVRDGAALRAAMVAHEVSAIVHCAGLIEVGRSVVEPDLFYQHNVLGTLETLNAAKDCGINRVILSSTGSVYGVPVSTPPQALDEQLPTAPSNPYAQTKAVAERMLADYCRAYGMTGVALRYFNAAGADASGLIGEAHDPETHLIPLTLRAARRGEPLTVFGKDFETPDGTCVRDYVHVMDVAGAHLAALDAPIDAGRCLALNVGSGRGHSVLEVIAAVERVTGMRVPYAVGSRRAGDPPFLVADPAAAADTLGWRSMRSDIDQIVADAAAWHADRRYGNQDS